MALVTSSAAPHLGAREVARRSVVGVSGAISHSTEVFIVSRFLRVALPVILMLPLASCTTSRHSPDPARGAAAEVLEGFADAGDGVRLFYRTIGTGRDTVVVIHGGPGLSSDYFADHLSPLAERGHTLLFYDQRGAGRSSLVSDSTALVADRFADDLEAIRRHFGLQRMTLLGHSWGAAVVALYATQRPERVERLLIVSGIPPQRRDLVQAFRALGARLDTISRRQLQEAWETWLADPGDVTACRAYHVLWFVPFYGDAAASSRSRGDFCAGGPEALRNSVNSVGRFTMPSLGEWDWRPVLSGVTAPGLVIHGTVDRLPMEGAREWAAALPGARLLLLEGIGHFPYVEAPETFFAAVDTFLRGGWPEGVQRVTVP
jgi:proline iminopeptidase